MSNGKQQAESGSIRLTRESARYDLTASDWQNAWKQGPDEAVTNDLNHGGTQFERAVRMSGDPLGATEHKTPNLHGFEFDEVKREGSQGVVFRARELQLGRYVAIKFMKPGFISGDVQHNSLIREARAVARLDHPNIVRLYTLQWFEAAPYLVMDWVDGGTLMDRLEKEQPTLDEAVALMISLTGAIRHAHENQILHRDIKPSNIMIAGERFQKARLTDFGLAKLGQFDGGWSTASEMVGTPSYMAPELFLGEQGMAGPGVDIYSLGAVFYRLLTGRLPVEGTTLFELGMKVMNQDAISPRQFLSSIPKDLDTICLKCLRKEPNKRYATAKALEEDLIRYQQKLPILARRETTLERWKRWAKRDPKSAVQVAGITTLLVLIIALLGFSLQRTARHERVAEARLSRTVEAMRISTPIFKKFLSGLSAERNEILKIVEFARLRENIEQEPENLVEKLQFHYVTLELADALRRIEGFENESLELNMKAWQKIGGFLDRYSAQAAGITVYESKADKFRITLLERAVLQYGHASCQLYNIMTKNRMAGSMADESVGYLQQAIAQARKALVLNPDLDEANINLADYLVALSVVQRKVGDMPGAENSLKSAVVLKTALTRGEPKQKDRWEMMIETEMQQANFYSMQENKRELCESVFQTMEYHLADPTLGQVADRGAVELKIITAAALRSRWLLALGKPVECLAVLDQKIDELATLPVKPFDLNAYERAKADLELERLQAYALCGRGDDSIQERQLALEQRFLLIKDVSIRNESLAGLYLLAPVENTDWLRRIPEILSEVNPHQSTGLLLNQLYEIKRIGMKAALDEYQNLKGLDNHYYADWKNQLKRIFLTESLIRLHRVDLAQELLEKIKTNIASTPLYPLMIQVQAGRVSGILEKSR